MLEKREYYNLYEGLPISFYKAKVTLHSGKIVDYKLYEITEGIKEIGGWNPEEIEEDDEWLLKNLYIKDISHIKQTFENIRTQGERHTVACRLKNKEGKFVDVINNFVVNDIVYDKDKKTIHIYGMLVGISNLYEYKEIFEAIDKNPSVGVAIYQEKYVYANKAAEDILEYSEEELKCMFPEEVVSEELRNSIRGIVERRLKGEQFDRLYQELPIKTKSGRIKSVLVFTRTVVWNGKPAGLVIFVDNTKRKKYEKLLSMFTDINKIILESTEEEEFLRKLCILLIDKADFRMAWIGKYTKGDEYVKPIFVYGYNEGYVENLKIKVSEEDITSKGPTGSAILQERIVVNPDTRYNPSVKPWREEMLKRNFLSSCSIPVRKDNNTYYTINIYTAIPDFFTEEEINHLRDLQKQVGLAIKKIESEKLIKLFSEAIEKGHDWIVITEEDGTIIYANPAVEKISNYELEEILGKNTRIFKSGYHSTEFYKELWTKIKTGKVFEAIFVNKKKTGELFYLDQTIVPVKVGNETRFVSIGKDITSERFLEEEIVKIKYRDPLTDMPNRAGFLMNVKDELERSRDKEHAMMVIDIRNLTAINQLYGTSVGDDVIKELSITLKTLFYERDIIGRTGGDEFGILLTDVESKDLTFILDRLFNELSKPFNIKDKTIPVSINVGISLYPKDAHDPLSLFEKASMAMNFAKSEGENTYRFFREELNEYVSKYFELKERIEKALDENRLILYFQPYFYTKTLKLAGFESLLRLYDQEKGLLTPADFIHILESTGMIRKVEDKLLKKLTVCKKYLKGDITISFNVSPKSFKDRNFIANVREVAESIGQYLVLEITERLLVEDPVRAREFLEEVKMLGVKIAVDDFGTGYSSLAYLESLPVDIIKLDISFIRKMTENYRSLAIVEAIIDLSRKLDIQTIAEGVEDEDTYALLKLLGCDMVQGFYFSKPLPMDEALELIESSK